MFTFKQPESDALLIIASANYLVPSGSACVCRSRVSFSSSRRVISLTQFHELLGILLDRCLLAEFHPMRFLHGAFLSHWRESPTPHHPATATTVWLSAHLIWHAVAPSAPAISPCPASPILVLPRQSLPAQ